MKFTYSILSNNFGNQVSANVKNTIKGIELSEVKTKWGHKNAYLIISKLLLAFVRPYSTIKTDTKEGRKELEQQLKQRVKDLEEEIKRTKLAIQMCKRKNAYFKEDKNA